MPDPTPDPPPLTLDDLRARRSEILQLVTRRHAANVAVAALDRLRLVVDFDDRATLLDQAGLTQDLESLLGRPVEVVSRRVLRHDDGPAQAGVLL